MPSYTRELVASNNRTSPEILLQLAKDPSSSVKAALINNNASPKKFLQY